MASIDQEEKRVRMKEEVEDENSYETLTSSLQLRDIHAFTESGLKGGGGG